MGMDVVKLILPNRNQIEFQIALVDEPAIESDFMTFNTQNHFQFKEVDKAERVLMGYFMIADMEILRMDAKRGAYKVVFPKESITMIAENFAINGLNKNINHQHKTGELIEGCFVLHSWQIDSKKGIKAPDGFKTEADGSWFGIVKCEDDATYEMALKKLVKGFSIEGKFIEEAIDKYCADKKVNDTLSFSNFPYNKLKGMKEEIKQAFEALIAFFSKAEKFEDLLLVDGVTKVTINPEVAVGSEFLILAEDGTAVKAPVLPEPYELQDGRKIMVEIEGVIASVTEAGTGEEELDADGKPKAKTDTAPAQSEAVKRLIERIEKVSEFEKTIPAQALEIESLKTENAEFKKQIDAQNKELDAIKLSASELKTLITENFKKLMEAEGKKPATHQQNNFQFVDKKEKSIYSWK